MSFLDNLENNLKALEGREEKDPAQVREQQAAREAAKQAAQLAAPHAEALRTSPFVGELIAACRVAGHERRLMVRPTWIGTMLRLEAGERRLELRPGAKGVRAVMLRAGEELSDEALNLKSDAARLAKRWLAE